MVRTCGSDWLAVFHSTLITLGSITAFFVHVLFLSSTQPVLGESQGEMKRLSNRVLGSEVPPRAPIWRTPDVFRHENVVGRV